MISRREILPSVFGLGITGAIANAQSNTYKKPEECNCKCEGKVGPPGPKGDKGDKGDPGICECKHEQKSLHVDFELTIAGYPAGLPEIIVNTPSNGALMDELWYYPKLGACVFFDYSKSVPEFIAFWRGGEYPTWDRITPLGVRVWNWHVHNTSTGKNHVCSVSLDKILSKPERIIQNWTSIPVLWGSF